MSEGKASLRGNSQCKGSEQWHVAGLARRLREAEAGMGWKQPRGRSGERASGSLGFG